MRCVSMVRPDRLHHGLCHADAIPKPAAAAAAAAPAAAPPATASSAAAVCLAPQGLLVCVCCSGVQVRRPAPRPSWIRTAATPGRRPTRAFPIAPHPAAAAARPGSRSAGREPASSWGLTDIARYVMGAI